MPPFCLNPVSSSPPLAHHDSVVNVVSTTRYVQSLSSLSIRLVAPLLAIRLVAPCNSVGCLLAIRLVAHSMTSGFFSFLFTNFSLFLPKVFAGRLASRAAPCGPENASGYIYFSPLLDLFGFFESLSPFVCHRIPIPIPPPDRVACHRRPIDRVACHRLAASRSSHQSL